MYYVTAWDWRFSTAVPLIYSVAYFASFDLRFLAALPVGFVLPFFGWEAAAWNLVLSMAVAYLMALGVGERWCRLLSLVVYWVMAQVAPWLVSLPLLAVGFQFSVPLPSPVELPIYIAVYWLLYQTHGRAVHWCQRQMDQRPPRCIFDETTSPAEDHDGGA
mgnify:CR=1 FL=1